jgi:hypothetical protein
MNGCYIKKYYKYLYHLHDIDTETHNRLTLSVLPKARRFVCSRNGLVYPDLVLSTVIPVPKIVEVVNQPLYRQSDEKESYP